MENPFHMEPSQFVGVEPAGEAGVLVVDKGRFCHLGQGEDFGNQLPAFFLRVQFHVNQIGFLLEGDFLPHLSHGVSDFRRAHLPQVLIAVDTEESQQGVGDGGGQLFASGGFVGFAEVVVDGGEAVPLFRGPGFLRGLAHQLLKLFIAARAGKFQEVNLGIAVEVYKLIVQFHFPAAVALGEDAGHVCRHVHRAEEFQHGYPLVPLLHIEPVHVLHGLDGVPDARLQMRGAKALPLSGELGLFRQQGHEVPGKGVGPSGAPRPDDELHRNLNKPQVRAVQQALLGDELV